MARFVLRKREHEILVTFQCPGCKSGHTFRVDADDQFKGPVWAWNNNLDRGTFSPSLLYRWDGLENGVEVKKVCHSFVTDGKIRFLSDCTHDLKDQTVDIPEAP